MEELVASRRVPQLRTKRDVIRNALFHGLHHIAGLLDDPDFTSAVDSYSLHLRLQDLMAQQDYTRKLIEDTENLLRGARGRTEYEQAMSSALEITLSHPDPDVRSQVQDLINRYQR